jgi:hypothetical protein
VIVDAPPDQRWALIPLALGFLAGFLIAHDCANLPPAHGQAPELAALQPHQTYAHALAVVTLNEAGFHATERDFGLIHQAASYHGSTNPRRLRWLRQHSQRVLGRRQCDVGQNCRWSRDLWTDPTRRPSEISATLWRSSRAELFERARDLGRRFAAGAVELEPCPVPIRSWGKRSDFGPGEILVDCGAANFGQAPWRAGS